MTKKKLCGDTFACQNGSVCKEGDGQEVDSKHKHMNLLSSVISLTDAKNYYCECNDGFIGHDCSVKVQTCTSNRDDLVHSCYYGSECIEAVNDYGLLDKFCDCSSASKEDGSFIDGLMCQYTSFTSCADDEAAANTSDKYCMNGGICKSIGTAESFPGCQCEDGKWEGKHCEFADGILKDDALDLFSVRKAEILYEESLHGLGSTSTSSSSSSSSKSAPKAAAGESASFNFTTFGVGFGVVLISVGLGLLMLFAVRRVRNKRQLIPDDESELFIYDGQAPPPNVFSSSRKKEEEEGDTFDDESTTMFYDQNEDSGVEMLDEATSRILESQFSRTNPVEEETVGQRTDDVTFVSYYKDHKDNVLDENDAPRIRQSHDLRWDSSVMSLDGSGEDDDDVKSNIMSLDGEHPNIMSLDGEPNMMSLDGDESDGSVNNVSNYRILSFV